MNKIELSLRFQEMAQGHCDGLLINNTDCTFIIQCILDSGIQQLNAQIFFIPKSRLDSDAQACFVIGNPTNKITHKDISHYTCVEKSIFVPQHAQVYPAVKHDEIVNSLHCERALLHPGIGIFHLDKEHAYRLSDLLSIPDIDLLSAQAGNIAPSIKTLEHIQVRMPENINEMFSQEQADIGSNNPNELDSEGLELGAGEKSMLWFQKLAAQGIVSANNLLSSDKQGPAWMKGMSDWANNKINQISERLEASRNKELNKLLDLLKNNPEEGLRYALPMNDEPGRGIAPQAGGHLTPHSTNFSLGGMGGGGVTDYWDLEHEMRQKLRESYERLAKDEISQGRYKKAAYIYAHLLGDYRRAAQALEDGGHFRDAAVIYEQKLRDEKKAAACLFKGGMARQAAEKYEKLNMFEEAAECMESIDNHIEALRLWELHIEKLIRHNDYLKAAKLIQDKRKDENAAIELLLSAWPKHPQNKACLLKATDLLHQTEQGPRLQQHIQSLQSQELIPVHLKTLLEVCTEIQRRNYSNALNEQMHKSARIQIAEHLDRSYIAYQQVLPQLSQLQQEDELLRRDCYRASGKKDPSPPAPVTLDEKHIAQIQAHKSTQLPFAHYLYAWKCSQSLSTFAIDNQRLVLRRINNNFEDEVFTWDSSTGIERLHIPVGVDEEHQVLMHVDNEILSSIDIPASDMGPSMSIVQFPNADEISVLLCSCYGDYGALFMLYFNKQGIACLEHWSESKNLVESYQLDEHIRMDISSDLSAGRDVFVCYIHGTLLLICSSVIYYWTNPHAAVQTADTPLHIKQIYQPKKWGRARLLCGGTNGFCDMQIINGSLTINVHRCSSEIQCIGVIGNTVVCKNENGVDLYALANNSYVRRAQLQGLHQGELIAINRGKINKELTLVYRDGHIQHYIIPILS